MQEIKGGQEIQIARTVEQLADQLEKSLRGEHDWHDHVVSSLEERVRKEQQLHQERMERLAEEYTAAYGDAAVTSTTNTSVGLTQGEVQDRLLQRQKQAGNMLRPMPDEKTDKFRTKWGLTNHDPSTR